MKGRACRRGVGTGVEAALDIVLLGLEAWSCGLFSLWDVSLWDVSLW